VINPIIVFAALAVAVLTAIYCHIHRDKLPRMTDWILYALIATVAIAFFYPQQLPVSLYKFSLVSVAAVVGYWIDRALFPYARPDSLMHVDDPVPDFVELSEADEHLLTQSGRLFFNNDLFAWAMLRRAIIVAAAMLAMGLGA